MRPTDARRLRRLVLRWLRRLRRSPRTVLGWAVPVLLVVLIYSSGDVVRVGQAQSNGRLLHWRQWGGDIARLTHWELESLGNTVATVPISRATPAPTRTPGYPEFRADVELTPGRPYQGRACAGAYCSDLSNVLVVPTWTATPTPTPTATRTATPTPTRTPTPTPTVYRPRPPELL